MSTISEPIWPLQDDRTKVIVDDFINDVGGRHANSVAVLTARLYGNGLRGQELDSISKLAQMAKLEREPKRQPASNVLVLWREGNKSIARTLRFMDEHYAAFAVRMLRRQPGVIFANRVRSYEAEPIVDVTRETFVRDMLSFL